MLYHVYLIFVVMYFVFLILATLTKKGGYALFAMLDLLIVMWTSAYFIQMPYSPVLTLDYNTTVIGPGSSGTTTNTTIAPPLPVLPTGFVFDPMTGLFFIPWFFLTIVIYGWCTSWGFRMDRGWF